MSDVQQLIDASRLYYELGETQSRVAELLGVTRPQVSRILKRPGRRASSRSGSSTRPPRRRRPARPEGHSSGSRGGSPASSIRGPEDVARRMIGRLGADVLRAAVRDGAIVGVGDGSSVSAVADAMDEPLRETARPSSRCAAATGSRAPRASHSGVSPTRSAACRRVSSHRASSTTRPRSGRSSPTPASAGSSTSGSGSISRSSASAARHGRRRPSAR